MALYGWHDCPAAARGQVQRLSSIFAGVLAGNLIGIYLHGSLAMGCFNPRHSDLDLLVITDAPMTLATKRQIIQSLLEESSQPCPVEISFLARGQLLPWRYPTPFDLHYSEMWRDACAHELSSGTWRLWNDDQRDPDLAAHVTVLNARGVCLQGAPIAATFPDVPPGDYRASLAGDIQDSLASIDTDPIYTILNCCRTYAYLRAGHIYSKAEGAHWALEVLPADLQATVRAALGLYSSEIERYSFGQRALQHFAACMRQGLAPILEGPAPN